VKFSVVGLSHRTAPIEVRERLATYTRDLTAALHRLRRLEGITEACIVSTCNRVEVYAAGSLDGPMLRRHVRRFLAEGAGVLIEHLEPHLIQHDADQALAHLFRVASSLDSMVLGEPQILGQVKEAYRLAVEAGVLRSDLNPVFQRAFSVAKRVRNETGIAENAVSMSFAAVELGRQIFADLEGREVLLVGAGKMGGLAAKHLWANGVGRIRVASRRLSTAEALAKEVNGTAASLDDLPLLLSSADIVICSTAAPGFVIDRKMVGKVLRTRRYRPLLIVDIAVPRDVEPRVGTLDNVFVYDVDDLEGVLDQNRKKRQHEAELAESLVREEVARFLAWRQTQRVVPVIKALRAKAATVVQAEVDRTLGGSTQLDPKTEKRVRAMANAITNKLLHPVLTRLKAEGEEAGGDLLGETVLELFDLSLDEPEAEADRPAEDDGATRANVVRLPGS
jgi:glutamyl-tRNA reductase